LVLGLRQPRTLKYAAEKSGKSMKETKMLLD
jgi:hypothetical protein